MIKITADKSHSMHFELIVHHYFQNETFSNEVIDRKIQLKDFYYLFHLPCGVYVDNYELTVWDSFRQFDRVNFYFDKDEVLCESICDSKSENLQISFAIELLALNDSSIRFVQFTVPLHKQYQVRQNHQFHLVNYSIPPPQVFVRNTKDIPRSNFGKIEKKFKESFLGNPGHYKYYPWEVPHIDSSEYRLVDYGQQENVTVTFPIGDPSNLHYFLLINSSIYIIISIFILFFLTKKI